MTEIKKDLNSLQNFKIDKQVDEERQKKVLEQGKLQEKENDKRFVEIDNLMMHIADVVSNDGFDVEQQKTFNDEILLFNEILLEYESLGSLDDCADIVDCKDILDKQEQIINELSNKMQAICEKLDIDFDVVKNSVDTEGGKINNEDSNQQLTWHKVKNEAQQHAKDSKQIDDELKKISAEISKKDKAIKNLKGQERKKVVLELKKFKEIAIKKLHQLVQEKIAVAEDRKATKKEILAEFGGLGTVYEQKKGSYRRFQIIKYSDGFSEIVYNENGIDKAIKIDEFRNMVAEGQFVKFYVPIKIEKEFALGKVMESKNGNTDEFPAIRVTKYNKAENKFSVKKFIGKKGEFVTMEEEELRRLINDGEYILQSEKRQIKENDEQNNDVQDIAKDNQKYEVVGVEKDISSIFDTKEIQEYIGTGKTKKSKENKNRIETYKKDIIESITEIERVSGRKINRRQFVIDYTYEKRATAISKILKDIVEDVGEEQIKEMQKTRDAADITFAQMNKQGTEYEKLNADTEQEGDKKFKEITRKVWKELVVHGKIQKNRETGKIEFKHITDLDGQMSLELLKKAGIKKTNVTYVPQGEYEVGKINIDTGNQNGLVILEDGTVIIDHHGDEVDTDLSGTKITYDILVRLGLLEKTEDYSRAIEFVNSTDNYELPNSEEYFKNYFKNSWKTLVGLRHMVSAGNVLKFFKYRDKDRKLSPTEPLNEELLREFGFTYRAKGQKQNKMEKHRNNVYRAHTELKRLESEGFIIESEKYGKICIDVNQTLNNDAVKAFGCDTYIKWSKDQNSFFISSLVGKEIKEDFSQGKNIRKTMWIKPRGDGEELTLQLKDVLEKMTEGKVSLSEVLQKTLNNNGERTDRVELTKDEKRRIGIYIKHTKDTLQFIEDMDLSEFGITKPKDVVNKKRELVKKTWEELKNDITKGNRFTSGQAKDIIDIMKDKL